tara:strand:+ start:501 stop:1004 length:504 start_codon:yes stop_codon:yes gene_type:complete
MAKMYRSSQGKGIDLGALLLQNENVRAVGNMGVNARGDRIDNKGKSIDSRVQQKKRQYNKQIGPQDVAPAENSTSDTSNSQYVLPEVVEPKAVPKTDTAKKTPARKKTVKKSTPVIDESIIDVEPKAEAKPKASGLADAIARAKKIKQEAIVPPRQAAQNQQGVKKI